MHKTVVIQLYRIISQKQYKLDILTALLKICYISIHALILNYIHTQRDS